MNPFEIMKNLKDEEIDEYIKHRLSFLKNKEETVLETSEHYLVTVKLNYNLLPSYNGKLYVVCLLETVHFPNDSNYILIQSNGICVEYGTFFKTYLGFINQIKRLNILSIFGIKDFNPKKSYNQNFNVNNYIKSLFKKMQQIFYPYYHWKFWKRRMLLHFGK